MATTIRYLLPVVNGYVSIPDGQILYPTTVTLDQAIAAIPGCKVVRIGPNGAEEVQGSYKVNDFSSMRSLKIMVYLALPGWNAPGGPDKDYYSTLRSLATESISDAYMWALLFDKDQETDSTTYPQSVTADPDGNSYSLSIVDSNNAVIIRKMSPAGDIQWESYYYNPEGNNGPSRIRWNTANGFLYALYYQGIQKIDPSTGSEVTSYWVTDGDNNEFISIGFLSDGRLVTISNFQGEGDQFILATWGEDGESGNIVKDGEWQMGITEASGNAYVNADIVVDSSDNVIIPLAYYDDGYGTLIVKWDIAEEEPIWQFNVSEDYFNGDDQDGTGFGVDADGNVYLNGYGRGLTKINSNGELEWARLIDQTYYGLAVMSDGSSYMYGDNDGDGQLEIVKFDTNGTLQYVNSIESNVSPEASLYASEGGGWYDSANSMAQAFNDKLYLVGVENDAYYKELILKLDKNLVTGTYGNFIFTDTTENLTVETATPLNDPLTLWYSPSSYLEQAPIAFESATVNQEHVKTPIGA